jgi:GTPase
MLIDEVDIILRGGHGGAGKVSFGRGKYSGPDGGNGGKGGSIYLKVTSDLTALNQFSKETVLTGENGTAGGSNQKFGKDGKDLILTLPLGTELIDKKNGDVFKLEELDQEVLICKGGLGGKGNTEFKSPSNTTPMYAQKGLNGQERELKVHLKLIADFGLIGLPNAGKSSLLNELTNANAKVGDYNFTTLEPNLGVLEGRVIADIPGLIEGASSGKGLGIRFLKHIEKVGLLLHCISAISEDPVKDYQIIRKELGDYNLELLEKEEIILLTKSDLAEPKELEKKKKELKKFKKDILTVSVHDWDSLTALKIRLR